MSQTTITDIGTVGIPVSDQDKAVEFFTSTLGFEKRLDARIGESFRWVTVAAPGASTSVALIARPDTGADTAANTAAWASRTPSPPPCARSSQLIPGPACTPVTRTRRLSFD